jgi:hypothetical protein
MIFRIRVMTVLEAMSKYITNSLADRDQPGFKSVFFPY